MYYQFLWSKSGKSENSRYQIQLLLCQCVEDNIGLQCGCSEKTSSETGKLSREEEGSLTAYYETRMFNRKSMSPLPQRVGIIYRSVELWLTWFFKIKCDKIFRYKYHTHPTCSMIRNSASLHVEIPVARDRRSAGLKPYKRGEKWWNGIKQGGHQDRRTVLQFSLVQEDRRTGG